MTIVLNLVCLGGFEIAKNWSCEQFLRHLGGLRATFWGLEFEDCPDSLFEPLRAISDEDHSQIRQQRAVRTGFDGPKLGRYRVDDRFLLPDVHGLYVS